MATLIFLLVVYAAILQKQWKDGLKIAFSDKEN